MATFVVSMPPELSDLVLAVDSSALDCNTCVYVEKGDSYWNLEGHE